MEWDDKLTNELNLDAIKFFKHLSVESQCSFPRTITGSNPVSLHAFSDASTSAMGVAIYLVDETNHRSFLLTSKSRVAPISKPLTIPKLELTALLLASRIVSHINQVIPIESVTLWCDSKVAISWCRKTNLKVPFIAKRVSEIQQNSFSIRYVPTKLNHADLLTRAESPKLCVTSDLWQKGPSFLTTFEYPVETEVCDEEIVVQVVSYVDQVDTNPLVLDLFHFSTLIH